MAATNRLFVRPMAWSSVTPSPQSESQNRYLTPAIQIFGYTSQNQTIYVRIPRRSTFILRFDVDVDDEMINELIEIMDPLWIKVSELDPQIVILRAREMTPKDLMEDPKMADIATWIEARQDPQGELSSFWESRNTGPYEWLVLEKYMPLPGHYTTSELNIIVQEDHVDRAEYFDAPEILPRLFFWDIETYGSVPNQFPNARNPDDHIFMISVITIESNRRAGYVIANGNINPEKVHTHGGEMTLIRTKSEAELLRQFLALYSTFNPDAQIYFNGDSFDQPYLLNRLHLHQIKLPDITRINGSLPEIGSHVFFTPYGTSTAKALVLPGVETIDLLHYYRRFYPHFSNHKLDTIARRLLEIGKNDLSIQTMMEAVRNRDPEQMAEVVDYSYVDSLRLQELWEYSDIYLTLEVVCNQIGVNRSMLLRDELTSLVQRAVFHIDPGAILIEGARNPVTHLMEATLGIYRHVHLYDYSKLYLYLMRLHGNYLIQQLGKRLKYAPPILIATAFYSKYANGSELTAALESILTELRQNQLIISIDLTTIRTTTPILDNRFNHLEMIPCFAAIAKASYIDISIRNEMETHGLAELCRPPFDLARDLIQAYLLNIYMRRDPSQEIPDLSTIALDRLTHRLKIEDITSLDPTSIKYKLAQQYGHPIYPPGINVEYVMSETGPVLISKWAGTNVINHTYYIQILTRLLARLRQLPVAGY